jgi:BASS family bile acid:Na+ symporter
VDIDLVRLTMNQTSINLLKGIIAFLMFAIALELKLNDFKLLLTKPKALITGICLHLLIFPILTYIFISYLDLRTSLALGLIMLAACPVGNLANLVTVLAKGNIALSVGLTSFTNLLSLFTTPLYIIYLGSHIESTKGYLETIQLDQSEILEGVFLILGLPVMLGMMYSKWKPHFSAKIQVKLKKNCFTIFALIYIKCFSRQFSALY